MATNRITGLAADVLSQGAANPNARVTGLAADVLSQGAANPNARVTGIALDVLVSVVTALKVDLTDDSQMTANMTADSGPPEEDFAADLTDGSVMTAALTMEYQLAAALTDESVLSARLTTNDKFLAADLTDESVMTARVHVYPPIHLAAALTDESALSIKLTQIKGTGPFHFAWVDADETTFDHSTMLRDDEDVYGVSISQEEGDFAAMSLTIKNPRIGLLNTGRKVWAWYSMYKDGVVTPLFFGRLIGVPSNVFATQITVQFTARPLDFNTQKEALAESLRVPPYWDPIFISPDSWEDPDTVLEGRSAHWHIDRITHAVTISDIIVPEDEIIEITEADHFYDAVQVSLNSVPLRRVTVNAFVPWTINATGGLDLTSALLRVWPRENLNEDHTDKFPGMISSFTFKGLSSDWPKEGSKIGTGWVVQSGALADQSFLSVPEYTVPDYFDPTQIPGPIPGGSQVFTPKISGVYYGGVDGAGFDEQVQITVAALGYGVPSLVVNYANARNMQQLISFTMVADMQAIATLAGDDEALVLNINANKVSDYTRDGSIPLGDVLSRTFADTPRGRQAVEHLIMIARANLVSRARAVQTTFQTTLDIGKAFTLRKGVLLHDHRLPGGQAIGKIIKYSIDISDGRAIVTGVLGSSVGYGGAYVEDIGDPSYVEEGYLVQGEYQQYVNEIVALPTADLTYTMPPTETFDDGIDFRKGLTIVNSVKTLSVTNGPAFQRAQIIAGSDEYGDTAQIDTILQEIPTQVHLKLQPLSKGPFIGTVYPTVAELIVPAQINLEADSNG